MRELTDSEQAALKQARIVWLDQLTVVNKGISESHKAGFIAALDYNAERIAALTAERDALAQRLKIAEEVEIYLGDKLQEEKQLGANRREVNAHLARERKKAEAERDAYILSLEGLRAAIKPFADNAEVWEENESHFTVVYCRRGVKDKPDLKITVGDLLAARKALGE